VQDARCCCCVGQRLACENTSLTFAVADTCDTSETDSPCCRVGGGLEGLPVRQAAAGAAFTVALTADGRVFQMGSTGASGKAKWEGALSPEWVRLVHAAEPSSCMLHVERVVRHEHVHGFPELIRPVLSAHPAVAMRPLLVANRRIVPNSISPQHPAAHGLDVKLCTISCPQTQ